MRAALRGRNGAMKESFESEYTLMRAALPISVQRRAAHLVQDR